jgi:hypothetical protein
MEAAFEEFAKSMFTLDRWPWWSAVIVFTIIGQFTSTKVFTRERAYRPWGSSLVRFFWYWMREALMVHPVAAGFTLGYLWPDPEMQGWPLIASMMYFASAGVISLGVWIILKGYLKRKGIKLQLPGESVTPDAPASALAGALVAVPPTRKSRHPLRRGL